MAKRDIERALRSKGLAAKECSYGWEVSPGGSAPTWTIYLDNDSTDFVEEQGCDSRIDDPFFDNTAQALEWIASLPSRASKGGEL